MSAAPLFDVTVTHTGREEHTLRLDEPAGPAIEEPHAPEAEDYEKRLERAQAAAEARLKTRLDEERAVLAQLAFDIRSNGGDPADELRRVLRNQLKRGATAVARLKALLDDERERRKTGAKARGADADEPIYGLQNIARAVGLKSRQALRHWITDADLSERHRLAMLLKRTPSGRWMTTRRLIGQWRRATETNPWEVSR